MDMKKALRIQRVYNNVRIALLAAMLLAMFLALGTQ